MSVMYCQTFVSPGTGATLHTCRVAEPFSVHYTLALTTPLLMTLHRIRTKTPLPYSRNVPPAA